ncbi:MAG: P-loop NTPase fold protein [Anaeromyxobacter sp.]
MWRDSEADQDFLNFTEVADQIAALVTKPELLPISVGVFGGWGTGKSTVLQLVQARLSSVGKSKPLVITFDAWLYQGFDDARAALMEVVAAKLLAQLEKDTPLYKKALKLAKRVNYFRAIALAVDLGASVATGVPLPVGSAIHSLAALGSGEGKPADYEALKQGASSAKSQAQALIKPEKKKTPPKQIHLFRKEFGEVLEESDRTLVLFVDNLDRCLPDVAIGTLEAMRLFLFMPRTAFVIAADEGMIRHSVAKHFSDPEAPHIRDYLDKVIQVPLRVPQVGPEDLRAYMFSLFVSLKAPGKLKDVQSVLMSSLQNAWRGATFTRKDIDELAGKPGGMLDQLSVADQLAPMLVSAPAIQGNPRIVKRLLNSIMLRAELAASRGMAVDLATLAKLAVFERGTDEAATLALYRIVMTGTGTEVLAPATDKNQAELPPEWKKFEAFVERWRGMDPPFDDKIDLKPAVFLSRDVMAPALPRAGITEAVRQAIDALLLVDSVASPAAARIAEELAPADRVIVMTELIRAMRQAEWSKRVQGVHGAIILAKSAPECEAELRAYVETLPVTINKGDASAFRLTGFLRK